MKIYANRVWLYERYIVESKSIYEIAEEAKCSPSTIQKYLEKYKMIKVPRKKRLAKKS